VQRGDGGDSDDGVVLWGSIDVLSQFARSVAPCSRFCARAVVASLLLLAGGRSVHDASATGDTRTLSFHHTHSDEDLTVTFKRNGRYDEDALKKLNHYLRDWRTQDETVMDRHLFDILWEVYREVGARQPIQIISSYRSPATNAMLRRRSAHTGVARFSQHMLGHAMDFFIPGVPLEELRFAGLRLQRGGVGFYPTSGSPFVHLDTGNVRHWPRMTRQQLVRVFPNGRTVHIPSDGNPLPGYELALADLEHRRADDGQSGSAGKPSLIASLFGGKAAEEDDEGAPATGPAAAAAAKPVSVAVAMAGQPEDTTAPAFVPPLPRAKPAAAATYQLAAATPVPQPAAPAAPAAAASRSAEAPVRPAATPASALTGAQTPADIINARGFWGDDAPAKQATPAQVAALAARNAFASSEPPSTASIPAPAKAALAYAPLPAAVDRSHIVAAGMGVPTPNNLKVTALARDAVSSIAASAAAKHHHDTAGVTTATRIAPAGNANSVWLRAMILAPSASRVAMIATTLGELDLTTLRPLFVKPTETVAMSCVDDPLLGMSCDHFSGTAVAPVTKTSFHTASLR
jgi:uncharacterized protein YcbK (DUF882 family)